VHHRSFVVSEMDFPESLEPRLSLEDGAPEVILGVKPIDEFEPTAAEEERGEAGDDRLCAEAEPGEAEHEREEQHHCVIFGVVVFGPDGLVSEKSLRRIEFDVVFNHVRAEPSPAPTIVASHVHEGGVERADNIIEIEPIPWKMDLPRGEEPRSRDAEH